MFGFKKSKMNETQTYNGERATYKQVAVTPKAHAKLVAIAGKNHKSIIETVNDILDV